MALDLQQRVVTAKGIGYLLGIVGILLPYPIDYQPVFVGARVNVEHLLQHAVADPGLDAVIRNPVIEFAGNLDPPGFEVPEVKAGAGCATGAGFRVSLRGRRAA
jgi:hypothetical protein